MSSGTLLSIVVPVYRSAATLAELHARIAAVCAQMGLTFELICVNDASPDESWQVLCGLHAQDARVRAINLARNFGQHPALLCGLAHAQGQYVLTMDDDLQHPPEEIPVLLNAISNDAETDVYIGSYTIKQHTWLRNCGTAVINWATTRIFNKDPHLRLTSFRIMRRNVVEALLRYTTESPRVGQLLLMITNRVRNVPVRHAPRAHGQSGYTLRRLIKDFLDNILSNSTLPLSFVMGVGFSLAGLSFLLALVYVYKFFVRGVSVSGWTTLVLLLLFFFGVLFFVMGIIGEYLIRILREARKHPHYIVREELL